jgi:hypothetical protein
MYLSKRKFVIPTTVQLSNVLLRHQIKDVFASNLANVNEPFLREKIAESFQFFPAGAYAIKLFTAVIVAVS